MNKREDKNYNEKVVAFYASALDAWYTTRFELDRALLALSSGAIGLFLTLLSTGDEKSSLVKILFILSTAVFSITIISILIIFRRNAVYLGKVIRDPDTGNDPVLGRLDKTASISFALGVIFSAAIVASILFETTHSGGAFMADDKENTSKLEQVTLKKSLDGAAGLQPNQQQQQQQAEKPIEGGDKKK